MINLDYVTRQFFYFDEPVPYLLKCEKTVNITPVPLTKSEVFKDSIDILMVDKNALPSVEIIQMSYLQFLTEVLFLQEPKQAQKLGILLSLCCGLTAPKIFLDDKYKAYIKDEGAGIEITAQEFDDIVKIILHQNILNFDDSYVNPELRKAMREVDELRNKGKDMPTVERKMAIIMSHTGISKTEQMKMTMRTHDLLFEEVAGEVRYSAAAPIYIYANKMSELDDWIYRNKKNKFNDYVTSIDEYNRSMGNNNEIKQVIVNKEDLIYGEK